MPRRIVAALALCVFLVGVVFGDDGARVAEMPGTRTHSSGKVTIDYSNAQNGYVAVKHSGATRRLKVRLSRGGTIDTYDLNGENRYEVFPLKYGDGTYTVTVWQNVSGSSYAQVYASSFRAELLSEHICYLYPNQYVWYDADSQAVAKAEELCEGLTDDMAKITALFGYVKDDVKYDPIKALTVAVGYMPDVDETLATNKGICFDKASLLACMLRSQGVPTQLVVGTLAQTQYHAWNKVYVNGQWRLLDATFANKYKSSDYDEDGAY